MSKGHRIYTCASFQEVFRCLKLLLHWVFALQIVLHAFHESIF